MYYPKSQIKTNLYTNGQELVYKKNNQDYIGYYWKISSGRFFTGRNPDDLPTEELIVPLALTDDDYTNLTSEAFLPINLENKPNLIPNNNILIEYNKLTDRIPSSINKINSYKPVLTNDDYNIGEFTRYFCKKTNEFYYIEINQDIYQKLIDKDNSYPWTLFVPFKYQWLISGEEKNVYKVNKNTTEYMISKYKFLNLNKFLKEDYLKFWKM